MLAFVQHVASFSDTVRLSSLADYVVEELNLKEHEKEELENKWRRYLVVDARKFLLDLVDGINPSMIAIDIWALTLLLGKPSGPNLVRLPYEFPLFGMIGHFLLIPCGVAFGQLAKVDDAWVMASTFTMILAVLLGWFVRHGIWRYYEEPIGDATNAGNDTQ